MYVYELSSGVLTKRIFYATIVLHKADDKMIAEVILMKGKLLLTAFFLAIAACVAYLAIAQNKVTDASEKAADHQTISIHRRRNRSDNWDEKAKFAFTELLPVRPV